MADAWPGATRMLLGYAGVWCVLTGLPYVQAPYYALVIALLSLVAVPFLVPAAGFARELTRRGRLLAAFLLMVGVAFLLPGLIVLVEGHDLDADAPRRLGRIALALLTFFPLSLPFAVLAPLFSGILARDPPEDADPDLDAAILARTGGPPP